MSWIGSLFGGQNETLNQNIGNLGQGAGFATKTGQSGVAASSDFMHGLLSGDPGKIGTLLAPQIGQAQKRGQQAKQTMSQFGSRSGGTTAAANSIDDKTRGDVTGMVSSLTGDAVSGLSSMGQGLIAQGSAGYQAQDEASQIRMQNWLNSILGKGISGAAGAAESFALGKM